MSLILDALRKMEKERKARLLDGADIRPEVLSYRGVLPKPSRSRILLPVTAVIILLAACIGGWLAFKEDKSTQQSSKDEASSQKAVTPAPAQSSPPPSQPRGVIAPAPIQLQPVPAEVQQPTLPSPQKGDPAVQSNDVSAASGITISGIAYQDERSMRRAVVNGMLLSEGAEVSGAKILEIKENRIKFLKNGQSFEVVHSSGTMNR